MHLGAVRAPAKILRVPFVFFATAAALLPIGLLAVRNAQI